MKYEIENLECKYALSMEGMKTAKDLSRKGCEAKRTIVKMMSKELVTRKLIDFDVVFDTDQKIIILTGKIAVLKNEKDEKEIMV